MATGWAYDENSGTVRLTIEQSGTHPPYRFPLQIETVDSSHQSVLDTLEIPPEAHTIVTLPHRFNQRPLSVQLDPEGDLLAKFSSM